MKTIYWISTIVTAAYLLWSSYAYLFSQSMIEGIKKLGFPDFFRIELAILKGIAVLVLVVPQIPLPVKEWAYAGIGLFYLTAMVAHIAHKDPFITSVFNIIILMILMTSYVCFKKMQVLW
ncbi:MAG: DoxX family protein [Bacteroidota bacterium]